MSRQIELMVSMQLTNPTNAIGLSKELIESCCKTILDELNIEWGKNDDVPQLANKTLNALNLLPVNVQETDQGAEAIRAVLGIYEQFRQNWQKLEIRLVVGMGKVHLFKG